MIFSKANLTAVDIAKADKRIPALDNLHLRADGTTIAANGSCVLAVSPVKSADAARVPIEATKMLTDAETVSSETVREILRGMPRDTLFNGVLENCDYSGGKFTLTDGKRHRTISARTYPREYIDYAKIFKRVGSSSAAVEYTSAINLRRLVDLLVTIDKMFPDSSKNTPIFLSFTGEHDVIIRAVDVRGRQRCVGVLRSYVGREGTFLPADEWEKNLCDSSDVNTSTTSAASNPATSTRKINKTKRA